MAEEDEDIVASLMVRHKDEGALPFNKLQSLDLDLYSIRKQGNSPPEPRTMMTDPPFPVKRIAEQGKNTQNQRSNHNTGPDENGTNHNPNEIPNVKVQISKECQIPKCESIYCFANGLVI
jgi:hypothetical protein